MRNARKGPLCSLRSTKALISLRKCAGWSGPSLTIHRLNRYCSLCRRIENVRITLHGCARLSWPLLFAHGVKALFPHHSCFFLRINRRIFFLNCIIGLSRHIAKMYPFYVYRCVDVITTIYSVSCYQARCQQRSHPNVPFRMVWTKKSPKYAFTRDVNKGVFRMCIFVVQLCRFARCEQRSHPFVPFRMVWTKESSECAFSYVINKVVIQMCLFI